MCHSVRNRHGGLHQSGDFLRGRIARIIPLYWGLTALALVVYLIAPQLVNTAGGSTQILHSFFLLPTKDKYLIQNGWTLSYEFYFYFLFSVGVLLPRALGRWVVIGFIVVLVTAGLLLSPRSAAIDFLFNSLLSEFAFGIVLYMGYERGLRSSPVICFGLGLLAVICWSLVNFGWSTGTRAIDYGLPAWVLSYALICRRGSEVSKRHRFLGWLGDISYSLYLSHPFVIAAIAIIFTRVPLPAMGSIVVGLGMIAVSLLSAGWLYTKVEVPTVDLARRILRHSH